jgi:EAL and modified HD-GYP domain-containing signal transduction protein
MLGLHRLKTWVTLLSLSGVEGKPSELMVTAMLRAAHCERVARMTGHETPDTLFTAGLFSVLDALLDLPMWEILEGLNLSDELSGALSDGAGEAGSILRCVRAHEEARWDDVEYRSLSVTEIMGSFLESVVWADETLATLDRVDSAD